MFFSRWFWGTSLVLLGFLLILRNVFNLDIPVGGIFWPLVLILFGIWLISRPWGGFKSKKEIVFQEGEISPLAGETDEEKEYNAVFGKGVFDLRKIKAPLRGVNQIKVNTVFGSGKILIDPNTPIKMKLTSAFGNAKIPGGESIAFGDHFYTSRAFKEKSPYVFIEANAVFGTLEVVEK